THRTGLRFRVNGPFLTTVNRADVPFDEDENRGLLEELAAAARASLTGLKSLGYLTPQAFDVLPSEYHGAEPVFASIRTEVVEALREDGVLPTERSTYARAADVALASES